jgi:hypothetical protein
MATQADVRRIAGSLPGVVEESDRFAFSVLNRGKPKGIAWVWLERLSPKARRTPNPTVLAVRVANNAAKDLMLNADPVKFFTEPHYNGYPAVLVRLKEIPVRELRALIEDAWRLMAPRELADPSAPAATGRRKSKATKARPRGS